MFGRFISAAVLAACTAAAQAGPIEFKFSYTGFFDKEADRFDPAAVIAGSFIADDVNQDGLFAANELLSFKHNNSNDYIGCGVGDQYFWKCTIERFGYRIGGPLKFSTTWSMTDVGYQIYSSTITGEEYVYNYRNAGGVQTRGLLWTGQTAFAISQVNAVPEPAPLALMALGAAGIGAARMRWRRRAA
ncbi:PEP-CTERM sorting domain-containing protein [Massilia sp. CCM 9210]|uniref:PEP-CTERM sorting domain-containing protein n=1 Tax=Massilia scottii TaxID=3057166 RepID=UPI0027965FD8|nr:PEP-CTERM sorting domain-containing protein [Massilia sp. CCM 9210]MDQ1813907.1 PEP-CTERM sorting domain-containing protein [Massilia sp. CCM 9210]